MWMRIARALTTAVRRCVDAERLAAAVIVTIMVLAAVDAAGRGKEIHVSGGFDLDRSAALSDVGRLEAARRAERRQSAAAGYLAVMEGQTGSGVQKERETGLNGRPMLSALERETALRAPRNFHKPATVILDATGTAALKPSEPVGHPLEVKVLARVDLGAAEVASAPAPLDPTGGIHHPVGDDVARSQASRIPADVVEATAVRVKATKRQHVKAAVVKVVSRSHTRTAAVRLAAGPKLDAVERTKRLAAKRTAPVWVAEKSAPEPQAARRTAREYRHHEHGREQHVAAVKVPQQKVVRVVALRTRTTADLSPGDTILRALRGPS